MGTLESSSMHSMQIIPSRSFRKFCGTSQSQIRQRPQFTVVVADPQKHQRWTLTTRTSQSSTGSLRKRPRQIPAPGQPLCSEWGLAAVNLHLLHCRDERLLTRSLP